MVRTTCFHCRAHVFILVTGTKIPHAAWCDQEKKKNFFFCPCPYLGSDKAMAPNSSTLARKIPGREEPGRLQSMGSLRVRHH